MDLAESVTDWAAWQQFGRLVMFPIKKNALLVRLQNSADLFDENAKDIKVNLNKFARGLWKSANP